MHPQDFNKYIDHLSEAFAALHEELYKVKRENKNLLEELAKQRNLSSSLSNRMLTTPPPSKKIHKMGADWYAEGDLLISLSLSKKYKFNCPICNVKISKGGQIAFSCNKRIFLIFNKQIFVVEDQIKELDPSTMKNDLTENFRCIFEFQEESLIIFYRNNIIKYTDGVKIWSIPKNNVYHLSEEKGLIYIGTREYAIYVYKEEYCIKTYRYEDSIKYFSVEDENVIGFSEFKIGIISSGVYISEPSRILALGLNRNTIYYGGESGILKVGKVNNTVDVIDTISIKKPILAIKAWGSFVVIATQDKSFGIWNLQQRKCMRIVCSDSTVDISTNERNICSVDTNGVLRIWQITESV